MRTLLSALLLLFVNSSSAQTVTYSAAFPKLDDVESKLFQCTNGNTFLFTYTIDDGIFMSLYDTAHKLKTKKPVTGRGWNPKSYKTTLIRAIYEINGDVVMFIQQEVEKAPGLFRVIIDATDASIKGNQKIGSLDKYTRGENYALSMGGDPKIFHVVKDAYSSCYAVLAYDDLAHSERPPLTVTHYDGNHAEISKAPFVLSTEEEYNFVSYIGMVTDSTNAVYLVTYAFNTKGRGGKRSKMFFSRLDKGSTSLVHKPLELTDQFKETHAALRFNKNSQTVDMLLLVLSETKNKWKGSHSVATNYYSMLFASVDAGSLAVNSFRPLSLDKLNGFKKSVLKLDDEYSGLPQNFVINDDHSASITFEQETPSRSGTNYLVNDMAVLNLGPSGDEVDGYVVRKQHYMWGVYTFAQHEKEKNASMIDEYISGIKTRTFHYSYDFVNTPAAQYFIFNDKKENYSKASSEKLEPLDDTRDIHMVCVKLANGKTSKAAMFDEANPAYLDRYASTCSSHFLPANQTYAVLLLERYGARDWKSRIAWVKFN